MKIKKNFLSRIARRKGAAQAESEKGHGIPPPAAIEPFVPDATGIPEDKELGSHRELELVASGEPAQACSRRPHPGQSVFRHLSPVSTAPEVILLHATRFRSRRGRHEDQEEFPEPYRASQGCRTG